MKKLQKSNDLHDLIYKKIKEENIICINQELLFTSGAIAHYNELTVIVLDYTKIKNQTEENTVLIQELGHYLSKSYYNTNSSFIHIEQMELNADICAWNEFFPYSEIKELMENNIRTATDIAKYYNVEVSYIARCLNYYFNNYNGFNKIL